MAQPVIRKPRFVLPSVLAENPDLPHDDDPEAFYREQEAAIEAKVRAEHASKNRNGYKINNAADPAQLERVLHETGIYPSSCRYLNDLMVKVFTRKLEEERVKREMMQAWEERTPDPGDMLAEINRTLDKHETNGRNYDIQPCPSTSNPFLRTQDIILLAPQSIPSRSSNAPAERYFAVHKTLLAAKSSAFFAHASKHSKTKVFNVDADANTVARMVNWLYNIDSSDLTRFNGSQLLALLCVALDICIPALHNDVILALMDQHRGILEPYTLRKRFAPKKDEVRRVYEKSNKGDGARMCIAYLLALGRGVEVTYDGVAGWERDVRLNASQWEAKEDMLGRWETMPAEAFFMSAAPRKDRGDASP